MIKTAKIILQPVSFIWILRPIKKIFVNVLHFNQVYNFQIIHNSQSKIFLITARISLFQKDI